jgi:hypothetical protein
MTMISPWVLQFAGFDGRRARSLAEVSRANDRRKLEEELAMDEVRFQKRSDEISKVPHIIVGATQTGIPYRVTLNDLIGLPSWITAATGVGKSRLVGGLMARVVDHIVRGEPVAVVAVDGKGETCDQLKRTIGRVVQSLPTDSQQAFVSRVHNFRFFDRKYLPSWPILTSMPGVAILTQADVIAEVLSDNAADATIGPRQRLMLSRICALAIEFELPVASLPWLMSNGNEMASLASRSSLPVVRLDLSRFDREAQSSIDGLISRIGVLLGVPSLKAVLSGERPFDFGTCLEPGSITTIDFGGADLGARAAVRAMGSLAISALANAAFDPRRLVHGKVYIVVDEPQAFLTSVSLNQFERLVTLGRSYGVGGIAFVHQGASQLPLEFQTILNTNIPLRILGRSSERDAEAASEWLPKTGRVPRPKEPGIRKASDSRFMSDAQEARFRITEIGHLPPRHFLIADRRCDFAPRIVQAADYNPPTWSSLDPQIADAIRRGSSGMSRTALEARVRSIEEEADARLQEFRRSEPSGGRRRARTIETPDVVGQSAKRRGGLP